MQFGPKLLSPYWVAATLALVSATMVTSYEYEQPWPYRGDWHTPMVTSRQEVSPGFNRRQLATSLAALASDPTLLVSAGLAAGNAAFTQQRTSDLQSEVASLKKRLDDVEKQQAASSSSSSSTSSATATSAVQTQICTNILKMKNDLTSLLAAGDTAGCPVSGCVTPQQGFTLAISDSQIAMNVLDTVNTVITRANAIVTELSTDITTCA